MEWLTEGLMVTILGLGTVFVVLIFICIILNVMSQIIRNMDAKEKPEEEKPVVKTSPAVKAENVNNVNKDMELIAAITAAVAAYESAKGNYVNPDKLVVRSFRRVNTWNREAIHEQQNNLY